MKELDDILTGRTAAHVEKTPTSDIAVHRMMVSAFARLRKRAAVDGFDIQIVSGFRDFASQLRIWNAKATGKRALLDAAGRALEFSTLSPEQIAFTILRWSALPAASRHHWGTDIDVIDRNLLPPDYQVQLTPAEVAPDGMFGPLHAWLDANMGELGFFRPYAEDRGGVSPERWHLSYAPVAQPYFEAYSKKLLERVIASSEIELKDVVLKNLDTIYQRFVTNISLP